MTKNKKILFTGARSIFCIDLARQLNASGHTVFTAESMKHYPCRFSNAIKKSYHVPSPRFQQDEYIKELVNIVETEKIDLLIPIFEEIFYISKNINLFPKSCQVFCEPFEVLDQLNNKWFFYNKLKNYNILTPQTTLISSEEQLEQITNETPYILKQCYSRASQRIQKVIPPNLPHQIPIESHNPWIAQQWIEGNKYCSYSICHKGELKAHTTYPVCYAIDNSSCLSFEAVKHSKILNWIEHFVKRENFTGQIAFDFIETEKEELYAIECNPRATSGIHLFLPSDQLDHAFLNENQFMIQPKAARTRQFVMGMLMYGWKASSRRNKKFTTFLKDLFSTKDVLFSRRDLLPFFSIPFLYIVYLAKCLKMKATMPVMFTHDIEWNGKVSSSQVSSRLTSML